MTYWCSECRTPITLMDNNHVPLYRKAHLVEKQWAIVKYFCSPLCSLKDHDHDANQRDTITNHDGG